MRVVALASDLMDRSRITAAIADIAFARDPAGCADADVVIVELRRALPEARIVAFGPHVDEDAARGARDAGADAVWPRSRFFRDPAAALAAPS